MKYHVKRKDDFQTEQCSSKRNRVMRCCCVAHTDERGEQNKIRGKCMTHRQSNRTQQQTPSYDRS